MTASKPEDTRDWVAIRRAYELTDETIKQICQRFGVTRGSFDGHYRRGRWMSRRVAKANSQGSTLDRLFAVLERQVTKLANAGGETLGDKEAQQLTELIKNFDKMTTIASGDADKGGPSEKKDLRDLRDKLAKRIEQFKRR